MTDSPLFNESKRNCAILLSRLPVYLSINFSTIGIFLLISSEIMAVPLPLTPLYGKLVWSIQK
jgi:hypothetical protein